MNLAVSLVAAVAAAALFALGTAVQSRALSEVEIGVSSAGGESGQLDDITAGLKIVTRALSYPGWLGGSAIGVAAFACHALALHDGNLTLVQPILVTSVLFALPASRIVRGTGITRREIGWAGALVLGLAVFFAAANPTGSSNAGVDLWPSILTTSIAAISIALCVALARGRAGRTAAALLGAGSGLAFAGVAALTKTATDIVAHGPEKLLLGWQLYGLILVGALGILLSQLAYRAGPLSASLPAMNSVNPLASVLIGVAVYDERVRTGMVSTTVEGLSLVAMTLATVMLSRLPRLHDDRSAPTTLKP